MLEKRRILGHYGVLEDRTNGLRISEQFSVKFIEEKTLRKVSVFTNVIEDTKFP